MDESIHFYLINFSFCASLELGGKEKCNRVGYDDVSFFYKISLYYLDGTRTWRGGSRIFFWFFFLRHGPIFVVLNPCCFPRPRLMNLSIIVLIRLRLQAQFLRRIVWISFVERVHKVNFHGPSILLSIWSINFYSSPEVPWITNDNSLKIWWKLQSNCNIVGRLYFWMRSSGSFENQSMRETTLFVQGAGNHYVHT